MYPKEYLKAKKGICTKILVDSIKEANRIFRRVDNIGKKLPIGSIGKQVAHIILIRTKSSFATLRLLQNRSLYVEGLSICRFILEQLAWAYSVKDLDLEGFRNTRSHKCISNFKKFYPLAGYFYGQLSDWVHVHPDLVPNFFNLDDIESELQIYLKGSDNLIVMIPLFSIVLTDCYGIVAECVHIDRLNKFNFLNIEINKERFKVKDMALTERLKSYSDKIIAINDKFNIKDTIYFKT